MECDDKVIICVMVEVVIVKNWKEIMVSGIDDFWCNVWFEVNLNGIKVCGYEFCEVDKQMFVELQQCNKLVNVIVVVEFEQWCDQLCEVGKIVFELVVICKYIDGDVFML